MCCKRTKKHCKKMHCASIQKKYSFFGTFAGRSEWAAICAKNAQKSKWECKFPLSANVNPASKFATVTTSLLKSLPVCSSLLPVGTVMIGHPCLLYRHLSTCASISTCLGVACSYKQVSQVQIPVGGSLE